jgi:nicotinamidase-related amidase
MLSLEKTVLIIVDVQGKLAQLMYKKNELFENLQKIIRGMQVLDVPIIHMEQYPEGLDSTVPEVASLLTDVESISKTSFSCWGSDGFKKSLKSTGRRQVVIAGIETHICVYQTTIDLLREGYEVQVVSDAVSSRTKKNRDIAISKLQNFGAFLTTTEMALFELIKVGSGEKFKELIKIVK